MTTAIGTRMVFVVVVTAYQHWKSGTKMDIELSSSQEQGPASCLFRCEAVKVRRSTCTYEQKTMCAHMHINYIWICVHICRYGFISLQTEGWMDRRMKVDYMSFRCSIMGHILLAYTHASIIEGLAGFPLRGFLGCREPGARLMWGVAGLL